MRNAENDAVLSAYQRALTYRDGLMIGLLARRPFRLKDVTALTLEASLVLEDETGNDRRLDPRGYPEAHG